MFGQVETEVAPEHCKNPNVAGFSLELERVDDGQGTKRQTCERECENGGERYWNEEVTMDGNGTVVGNCNMNVLTARERALSWAGHVARMDYSEIWSAPKTIQNL